MKKQSIVVFLKVTGIKACFYEVVITW